jgi:hypothetical protein
MRRSILLMIITSNYHFSKRDPITSKILDEEVVTTK